MSAFDRYRSHNAVTVRREAELAAPGQVPRYGAPPDDGIDIKSILAVLRRRRVVVLTTVAVMTALVALVALNLTPQYRASAAILIEPRESRVLDVASVLEGLPQKTEVIKTQITLLQSQPYAEQAIAELGLLDDPRFNAFLRQEPGAEDDPSASGRAASPAADDGLLARPGRWFEAGGRLLAGLGVVDASAQPGVGAASPMELEAVLQDAARALLADLEVEQYEDTYVILIHYSSPDPKTAARVANKFAEIYITDQLAMKQTATARASAWLSERLTELRRQLLEAEAAVETYRAEQGLVAANGTRLNDEQVVRLNEDLITVRAERAERATRLQLIRDLRARGEDLSTLPEFSGSAIITDLRQRQAALQREEAQLSQEFGPRHPRILQLQAEKQELGAKIDAEVQSIIGGLESQVAVARAREQAIQEGLEGEMAQSAEHNQADVQLRMLEREADANRSLYTAFLNRFKQVSEQGDLLEPDARFVSRASVPEQPSFPRPNLMIAAGFTSSLMLGTLLAFLMEGLDSGLRSARQVERVLGIPRMGLVPKVRSPGRCGEIASYVLQRPQSAYAEAIRAVQTGLFLSTADDPPRVILVTSSLPGEGKSTLATSLAVAAARPGHKTIIVDLDLRQPQVAAMLDVPDGSPGLVEYMAGQADLDDVICTDASAPSLDVLPVRRLAANPTDLLGSRKMAALLDELRERYDYVFLDSAPILGISDAKMAARLADAVLFAVRWGRTKEEVALNALEELLASHANVAGAVLTQVNLHRHARYSFGDAAQYYGKYKRYYTG